MNHSFDLETAILDILYQKSVERPLWVSESEVYWSIPDMNVTERDVREGLEQLVYHRRVLKQVGKYQITKTEFLSIKERIENRKEQQRSEQEAIANSLDNDAKSSGKPMYSEQELGNSPITSLTMLWRIILCILIGGLIVGFGLFWNDEPPTGSSSGEFDNSATSIITKTPTATQKSPALIGTNDINNDFYIFSNYLEQSHKGTIQTDSLQNAIIRNQGYILRQNIQLQEQVKWLKYGLVASFTIILCLCILQMRRGVIFFLGNKR